MKQKELRIKRWAVQPAELSRPFGVPKTGGVSTGSQFSFLVKTKMKCEKLMKIKKRLNIETCLTKIITWAKCQSMYYRNEWRRLVGGSLKSKLIKGKCEKLAKKNVKKNLPNENTWMKNQKNRTSNERVNRRKKVRKIKIYTDALKNTNT